MSQQQTLINGARTQGEQLARHFVDRFETQNKSPTMAELEQLRSDAADYFAEQPVVWTDDAIVSAWRDGFSAHLASRIKFHATRRSAGSVGHS
jgi:hypothetical protein